MLPKLWQFLAIWCFVFVLTVRADGSFAETQHDEATGDKMTIVELNLNDQDMQQLIKLEENVEMTDKSSTSDRDGKSFKDASVKLAAEALTDDEITSIIKSISQPNEENITEDAQPTAGNGAASALTVAAEPRNNVQHTGRGYYIIAPNPVKDELVKDSSVPYVSLQVLPAERSANSEGVTSADSRVLSAKSWNKFIRRLMRQIRRGTRKVQRKTRVKKRVKKLKEEPTLESFLNRMYVVTQEQRLKQLKKKKSSWFLW